MSHSDSPQTTSAVFMVTDDNNIGYECANPALSADDVLRTTEAEWNLQEQGGDHVEE